MICWICGQALAYKNASRMTVVGPVHANCHMAIVLREICTSSTGYNCLFRELLPHQDASCTNRIRLKQPAERLSTSTHLWNHAFARPVPAITIQSAVPAPMSKCSHRTRSTKGRMKLPKKHVTITCAQPVGWRDSLNTRQREYGQVIPMHTLWKLAGAISAPSSCAPSRAGSLAGTATAARCRRRSCPARCS